MSVDQETRLRRHAIEIVAQLPEAPERARAVLRYAEQIVDGLDGGDWYAGRREQGSQSEI